MTTAYLALRWLLLIAGALSLPALVIAVGMSS